VVELKNPISDKYALARDMLLPQLLEFLAHNTHCAYPQKIFEQGRVVYSHKDPANRVKCPERVAGTIASKQANYNLIRGQLEGLMESLGQNVIFKSVERPFYLAGRSAAVFKSSSSNQGQNETQSQQEAGERLGHLGEIDPRLLTTQDISMP